MKHNRSHRQAIISLYVAFILGLLTLAGTFGSRANAAAYDEDRRQTEEEYAASHLLNLQELKESVAATGVLYCPGLLATAQLTSSADVITTAGHVFVDPDTCRPKAKVSACIFTYKWKNAVHSIPLAKDYLKIGLTCPFDSNNGDDWAVVKLAQPAQGVVPYNIAVYDTMASTANRNLLAVEGLSVDFCVRNPKSGKCLVDRQFGGYVKTKTLQDCTLKSFEDQKGRFFLTDCAGSNGASGSSILSQDDHTLLGIRYTDSLSKAEVARETATGRPIIKPYDRKDWSASEVPVAGDFAKAIMEAAEGKSESAAKGDGGLPSTSQH